MNARPLILNVDDDDAARYVKSRILRLAGFAVVDAANGAAALEMLRERAPDLVLLDVRLPDVDGRELCAQIKGDPAMAQVTVLQTSASYIDAKNRVASLDAGADGYLVAPFEPEELVAHVRALLRMRKAEAESQKALEALREADRRKDEFLAMLAHELRNPLAPIRNAVEILRISADRPTRERARELIGRQVQHLARLVDDLLDVSRITQRKVALQRGLVNLATVVEAAVEVVRPAMVAQAHALTLALPGRDVWLDADAVRLSQVLGNLLHNAAKFTPPGGAISLEVRIDAPAIEIVVADNGVGIPAEMLPTVFDLFSQGDRTLARSQGGLGIGLSLVKGLVELHGGTVQAASAGPGHGSRFTVRLPWKDVTVATPSPAAAPQSAGGARRILIVEDNEDAAEAMELLLRGMGHEVNVVNDGHAAVDAARHFAPDIVLLDIGLPGLDGYQLAKLLREMPETRAARLIAVSGYGQSKDRERSAAAGFHMHLVKPVDPSRLLEAIGAIAA